MILLEDDRLATASSDQKIKIWNYTTGICELTLIGHQGYVCTIIEWPNKILLSGSHDKCIKFWDLNTGKNTLTIKDPL